jgi:AraC family transcriptional regulator of arabinose operon
MEPALQAFFWEWVAALPDDMLSTRLQESLGDERFEREALAFFSESRGERFDMGALSRRLGLSPRALEYRFRRHFGTSPARALAAHKVKEGALMLCAGAMVNEVADALGFANPFHFSRVFKRIMKVTPSAYRER